MHCKSTTEKGIIYFLIVLEIGGGFMGLSLLLASQPWDKSLNSYLWIVFMWTCFIFFLGIVAGLALVNKSIYGFAMSAIFQAFQIPYVSSPIISYQLLSGIQVVFGVLKGMPVFMFDIGARSKLIVGSQIDPWGFGINFLALILFVYLIFQLRPKHETTESKAISKNSSVGGN